MTNEQDLAQATSVHNFVVFFRDEAEAGRKIKNTVFRWMVNETWFSPRLYPAQVRALHPRSPAVAAGEPFEYEHVVTMSVCTTHLLTSESVQQTLDILQRCSVFALVTSAEHQRLDRGLASDIDDPWARYRRAGIQVVWPTREPAATVPHRQSTTRPRVHSTSEPQEGMDQEQSYANGLRHSRETAGLGRVKAANLLGITTSRLWKLEYSTPADDPEVVTAIDRLNALT